MMSYHLHDYENTARHDCYTALNRLSFWGWEAKPEEIDISYSIRAVEAGD